VSKRIQIFKGILWFVVGLATAVTIVRFTRGLGATTALSDTTPWGLWVGFDVMGGVALAAGGFVVAAIVHIFRREKYHAVARPAILTAMLGYAAVAVGLLYDLGLPWNIWHPMIYWNPRSPLFEVAWCVMLYLTVLVLEFSPVLLERTPFKGAHRFLLKLQLPLIVLGIMLSTLHQSSLGSLMLIMPFRLHPLWYTSMLPELFFVSAICLGLAMVIFESTVTSWLYERKPETEMLAGLGRLASFGLAFYLAFRLFDLGRAGKLGLIFEGSGASLLFLTEIGLCTLLPLVLFAIPAVRRNPNGVFAASSLCVIGFVLNRISTSGLAQQWATGSGYVPVWTEFAISLGIVAGFALIFFFIQEHFPVDEEIEKGSRDWRKMQLFRLPEFRRISRVWLGDAGFAARRVYSLLFVGALALGLAFTPWSPLRKSTPVQRARGGEVLRVGYPSGTTHFPHERHIERMGRDACGSCHHLNKLGDKGTPCSECHRDLYLPTRIFDHTGHVAALEGRSSCAECHVAPGPHVAATAKTCSACHEQDMMSPSEWVTRFASLEAPGMRPAMHELCIGCHEKEASNPLILKPDLHRCATCHKTPVPHREELRSTAEETRTAAALPRRNAGAPAAPARGGS
jgi:Ni/Fe-hydrogenase subunit HybB-like protein